MECKTDIDNKIRGQIRYQPYGMDVTCNHNKLFLATSEPLRQLDLTVAQALGNVVAISNALLEVSYA